MSARRACAAAVAALAFASAAGPAAAVEDHRGHHVLPLAHHSRIALGHSLPRLVREGVLSPRKLEALYAPRGGLPAGVPRIGEASPAGMVLTPENAAFYVNVLWPVGLANRMAANDRSPLRGPSLARYASTAGWVLGEGAEGSRYFNRHDIVALSPREEARVESIARSTFRPCCDNSTFFQDCNHGSALLGLLALGAAQGLTDDELYREALAFNAFWFPQQYAATATYFEHVMQVRWQDLDARAVLGARYSSASGWRTEVAGPLEARGLMPKAQGGDCAA